MFLTIRKRFRNQEENDKILAKGLDTVDKLRDLAKIQIAAYQQRIYKFCNKNIRVRRFRVGDLVLIKVFQNTVEHSARKLTPKREGPYLIDLEAGKRAYWISNRDG